MKTAYQVYPVGISTVKVKNIDVEEGVVEIFKIDACNDTIDGAPASRFVSRLNKNVKRTDFLDRLY